jgi:hypothetical protein
VIWTFVGKSAHYWKITLSRFTVGDLVLTLQRGKLRHGSTLLIFFNYPAVILLTDELLTTKMDTYVMFDFDFYPRRKCIVPVLNQYLK